MLSALAGAAQELQDALIINPHDGRLRRRADPRHRDAAYARTARMRAMRAPSPDGTCSAGPPTSSKAWKACGRSHSTTLPRGAEDAPV